MSGADNNRRTNKMRTIRIKLHKFSELSEVAQQKVLDKNCYINVDYDWWQSIYEDAKAIGAVNCIQFINYFVKIY